MSLETENLLENKDLFFAKTMAALTALQAQDDRPYNAREMGLVMKTKHSVLATLPIELVSQRIGTLLVNRVKGNTIGLVKSRSSASNKVGGSYLYQLSDISQSKVA